MQKFIGTAAVSFFLSAFLFGTLLALPRGAEAAADSDMSAPPQERPTELPGYSTENLRQIAELVQRTGVAADAIPALNRPRYLSLSDASLSMDDDEVVFVVRYPRNLVRVYPQRILVWHEIVNDVIADTEGSPPAQYVQGIPEAKDERYTISYSPLTGSVVGFRSRAGKYFSTFAANGNLLNGNSVLYDRVSLSLWSQLLAISIEGPFRGKRLERFPVLQARWKGVKERYGGLNTKFSGKVEVLSRATGFKRSYGKDPYGSYQTSGSYYDSATLPFPVSYLDTRLPPKKRILGLEKDGAFGAVQKDVVRRDHLLNFALGLVPMVALHDRELDGVSVYDRRLESRELSFIIFEDKILDEQTRSEWSPDGVCVYGPLRDKRLEQVLAIDSMWFAWASFYRGTSIFPYDNWK